MVFFTCNHCGESLKKAAVEKHYQWKTCKGAPVFLCCIDCLKDFKGDEYIAHTKCITELEKYSAKGFVAKPDQNKGARKQEAWTETIQKLVDKPSLDDYTKQILQKISNHSNVPRKKAKFLNFIKSSMRMSPNNAMKLWVIIEEALGELTKKAEIEKNDAEKRKLEVENSNETGEPTTKKSKKSKKSENLPETSAEPTKPKKDKKAKNKVSSTTNENGETIVTKKIKKLLPGSETNEVVTNGNTTKKSKKQKKNTVTEANNKVAGTNGVSGDTKLAKANNTNEGFEWKQVILKIVSKKNEIKTEKLKEKVLKQFAKYNGGDEITPKNEKTFLKHLKKSKTIVIEDDTVKLVK